MFSIFRKTPLLAFAMLSRDKMPSNFMNSWIFLTAALSSLTPAAVGIRCLECNELPDGAARSQCPGAALINFGAKFDVSNECVQRRWRESFYVPLSQLLRHWGA